MLYTDINCWTGYRLFLKMFTFSKYNWPHSMCFWEWAHVLHIAFPCGRLLTKILVIILLISIFIPFSSVAISTWSLEFYISWKNMMEVMLCGLFVQNLNSLTAIAIPLTTTTGGKKEGLLGENTWCTTHLVGTQPIISQ